MNKINSLTYYMLAVDLKKAFKFYGIEGTEEKIKEVYSLMPELKAQYLEVYSYFLKGKHG